MTNLDNILKSRDITLPTNVSVVKAIVCPVITYGCERRTIKKAEHQRIGAFELWYWRILLRVPWSARRSNQSILMKISPEYSWERLLLKLKLQYFGHLMQRTDSLEKDPDSGKYWRWEEKGMTEDEMVGWHHWPGGHEYEQAPGVGDGQGGLACYDSWGHKGSDREAWCAAVHGITKTRTWLRDWSELIYTKLKKNKNIYSATLAFWKFLQNFKLWQNY